MIISLILVCSLFAPTQQPDVLELPTVLERVTVYPGQALCERIIDVPVHQTGPMTISVGPLPLSAQASSFQTEVIHGAVVVQGLELRRRTGSSADWAEADALRTQLESLRWNLRLAEADLKGHIAARDGLQAVIEAQKSDPTVGGLLPEKLEARLKYIREQMTELRRGEAQVDREIQVIISDIADLQNQLDPLANGAKRDYREVRLAMFVEQIGSVRLRLTYLSQGAWWQPAYDVRVAPDLTGVNVGLVGQVTQRTGEDWTGVELLLSTSMPALGLDPPELPKRLYSARRRGRDEGMALEQMGYAGDDGPMVASRKLNSDFAPAPVVEVRDFGITTQFVLPGKNSVRSNGEAHRFRIRVLPLEVRPERYVVPSLSTNAYLRAKVTHTGEAPLLPGIAKVFLGPDYLGEASFPVLRQGDSTMLNLGIDPNLLVEWEQTEDERSNPGSFSLSSTSHIKRSYRATLTLSASARGKVSVLVEEALPMQTDDRIEVELLGLQPKPVEGASDLIAREEKGIYRWRLLMSPGSTHAVRWSYQLSFDEDLNPRLIER